jgi:protein phosphatase 2C family protein 2/3
LSVSRTFGDIEAKIDLFGGLPGVVIAKPDIKEFDLNDQNDFLILSCDGIFDTMTSQKAV